MKKTQSEFIKSYCAKSSLEESKLNERSCAVFCDCEDGGGVGHWAIVSKEGLKDHCELYIKTK